jgi:large subunit ribosomal protein L23
VSKYHSIIKYPSITEKNTTLRTDQNKYVFEVALDADKTEIKEAVQKLFNVDVVAVNTLVVKGKKKRTGRSVGYRSDRKKAIVKIKAGQNIEKFGEV